MVRFGGFELDIAAGQLRKHGVRLHLRDQPVQVLSMLVQHPGQVITREELQRLLWPNDVDVDFENNLNTAIGRLRDALGDSAKRPHFIETLPRRGYRFIAKVVPEPVARAPLRLLVLPFVNLSGDSSQEYFSDAIADEVITALAAFNPDALAVIARTTAIHYRGTQRTISEIGRELRVDYVLEGSVRREGDDVALIVQLVRVGDQAQVMARRYLVDIHEIFEMQGRIAREVAAAVEVIGGANVTEIPKRPTQDLVAYNEFIQARHVMSTLSACALAQAKTHLERAIARDPQFALAFDSLAEIYWLLGYYGFVSPKDAFTKGVLYAMRAVEIDNTLGETHALLAQYHKQLDYDWPSVSREMARARELNPASPVVRSRYAVNELMPLGRVDEATTEIERSLDLDPLSPYLRTYHVVMLVLGRRYDEAIEHSRLLIELEPNAFWGYLVLGSSYRELNEYEKAIEAHQKALELSGGAASMMGWLGMSLARGGRNDEARQLLYELETIAHERYVPASSFAWIYHGLGELDQEFEWLDRAIEERDQLMMPIRTYAFFDPIRSDPRFTALLAKMRLDR